MRRHFRIRGEITPRMGLALGAIGMIVVFAGGFIWYTQSQMASGPTAGDDANGALPDGARFKSNDPLAEPTELMIRYHVAVASVEGNVIAKFLTLEDLDRLSRSLAPEQYQACIHYTEVFDPDTGLSRSPSRYTVYSQIEGRGQGQRTFGGFEMGWDPKTRTLLNTSWTPTGVVGPALIPLPPPRSISVVTVGAITERGGMLRNADVVTMQLKRSGNVFPRLAEQQQEFFDCWEYEAVSVAKGGKLRPRVWVEKNTGIVWGGFGDFASPFGEGAERVSWIVVSYQLGSSSSSHRAPSPPSSATAQASASRISPDAGRPLPRPTTCRGVR